MVQVQFYISDRGIAPIEDIEVLLDGISKISNANGLAIFDNITQGSHSYEVRISDDYTLDYGRDPFVRPLAISGMFTIEWVPDPSQPYPEEFPWVNQFYFIPIVTPPPPIIDIKSIAIPGIVGVVLMFTILRV